MTYYSSNSQQQMFNPIDYGFTWDGDWYKFNYEAARKAAMAARSKRTKELKAQGWTVKSFTLSDQRITRGGIGSKHPEITQIVSVYGLNARR
jgi:hypothetical protein